MAPKNVGINSTFEQQRQVINQIAVDVDNLSSAGYLTSANLVGYATETYVNNAIVGFITSGASGSNLTGIATYITAGSGISVNQNTGNVTINVTSSPYSTTAGIATYSISSGISTYAITAGVSTTSGYSTTSGIATYATTAGVATNAQGLTNSPSISVSSVNSSGIVTASSFRPSSGYIQAADGTNSFYIYNTNGNVAFQGTIGASQINSSQGYKAFDFGTTTTPSVNVTNNLNVGSGVSVSGISTFTNGPVLIGSGTSTGTASQRLQITGGGYVSGKFGVGTTNPTSSVSIAGSLAVGVNIDTFAVSNDSDGIVRAGSNIIGVSSGSSRVNIQDRSGSFLSFFYGSGLIGRLNVINTTDLSVEVGGSERVRIHNSTGNVGIGTNNANEVLSVLPKIEILNNSNADGRLILRAKPGNSYRWNIDNDGSTNNLRFFKEDDATAANGAVPFQITTTGNATLSGNLNAAGNYYVKLARTSNQTINNGSDTLIGFSAISDGNSWFNSGNNRITPTVAGNYYINAMVKWEAGAATNTVQSNIQIRRNGNTVALSVFGVQTHTYTMNINAIVTMNGSSDYIEFTVYTGNPTSQVVGGDAGGTLTKLEMFKLN